VTVHEEQARFAFAGNFVAYYPEEASFFSHNERHYLPRALGDLAAHNLGSLPAIVDAGHVKVAIAEADIEDYPGLWLRGSGRSALDAAFPPYPLEERLDRDRDLRVVKTAGYIARTRGTRTYPWRILGLARRDADLVTNPLVYLLQSRSRLADTSWIAPGKVAWDWWNANNIDGVDFEAGVNTATYRHYIDFAAAHGLEYVILDEGWYELGNVLKVVPAIDMPAIMAHAREKGVGIILWVVWKTLDDQLDAALDQFAAWGAKGIKVDFMQRDDQPVVAFYHRVSEAAAKRRLLVDFHGSLRPAMMTRTWPHIMSVEGVRGLEWAKWSAHANPEHDATLPFTRMVLGPMDYTPGAMVNASRDDFAISFNRPMSLGTRAHQLALYVVFESPLQMLADSPSNYRREPDAMAFLGPVPSAWDETRVLDARIADYILVARRHGDEWYVGAITDWSPRDLQLDLAFLGEGTWTMEAWADGPNARRRGEDMVRATRKVDSATRIPLLLAPGGGFAARIRR
jgi:alpha-glucosidase